MRWNTFYSFGLQVTFLFVLCLHYFFSLIVCCVRAPKSERAILFSLCVCKMDAWMVVSGYFYCFYECFFYSSLTLSLFFLFLSSGFCQTCFLHMYYYLYFFSFLFSQFLALFSFDTLIRSCLLKMCSLAAAPVCFLFALGRFGSCFCHSLSERVQNILGGEGHNFSHLLRKWKKQTDPIIVVMLCCWMSASLLVSGSLLFRIFPFPFSFSLVSLCKTLSTLVFGHRIYWPFALHIRIHLNGSQFIRKLYFAFQLQMYTESKGFEYFDSSANEFQPLCGFYCWINLHRLMVFQVMRKIISPDKRENHQRRTLHANFG